MLVSAIEYTEIPGPCKHCGVAKKDHITIRRSFAGDYRIYANLCPGQTDGCLDFFSKYAQPPPLELAVDLP